MSRRYFIPLRRCNLPYGVRISFPHKYSPTPTLYQGQQQSGRIDTALAKRIWGATTQRELNPATMLTPLSAEYILSYLLWLLERVAFRVDGIAGSRGLSGWVLK